MVHEALQRAVLLCIDDNQDVLDCERAFLETFGYTVLTALSGRKGLELASVHPVDVVIGELRSEVPSSSDHRPVRPMLQSVSERH